MISSNNILLVTVTKVESLAVLAAFEEHTQQKPAFKPIGEKTYHELGTVNGVHVWLVRSEMGAGGLGASQQSVTKAIGALSPRAVIMLGIAFGMDERKQAIGDILVSTGLQLYDLQRVGTDAAQKIKITIRGSRPDASPWLLDLFRNADLHWRGAKVCFGVLLTGDKLVDNYDFREELKRFAEEAIGGEMEGAGLYVSCHDAKVDWILVKGICDWGDGHKNRSKQKRQELAARNAARFVVHGLFGGLPGSEQTEAQVAHAEKPLAAVQAECAALPSIVHFGCGKLAVGAVIPFLIQRYGTTHQLIVVQRCESKRHAQSWAKVRNNGILPLLTTAGDFMPFRTVIFDGSEASSREVCLSLSKPERRLLLLLPDINMSRGFLENISTAQNKELLISCSLGGAQEMLIQLLRICPKWEKALVFENTAAKDDWSTLPKPWYHVIVDRICWQMEFFPDGQERVRVHCEAPEHVSFSWPADAQIPAPAHKIADAEKVHAEHLEAETWKWETFPKEEIEWYRLRKRALVNAPHAITAYLCYQLLADRKMGSDNQYLAPIQEMLRTENPAWEKAMDDYLRLRAFEVAWKCPRAHAGDRRESLHAYYEVAYATARAARRRFFATTDRLDRIMSQGHLRKEFDKWREHIREPLSFYNDTRAELRENWVYGCPNDHDILCLRDLFEKAFAETAQGLAPERR
jgi:nucleoside phosphorylase